MKTTQTILSTMRQDHKPRTLTDLILATGLSRADVIDGVDRLMFSKQVYIVGSTPKPGKQAYPFAFKLA